MAITKSAKKAIRQSKRRREFNLTYKNSIKKLIKKATVLAEQKNNKEAMALLPGIYSILDKAAKKGVIKKNNASRRKARLTKLFSK
jgi:small subunit ribosomal protein S20